MIEHRWVSEKSDPTSFYERRKCTVCGLDDRRIKDRFFPPGPLSDWTVRTSCIVQVVGPVCLEDLQAELDYHRVEKKVCWRIGPGYIEIGFSVPHGIYPCLKAKDLETGFADLLRWMRARQFNVYLYSRMFLEEHDHERGSEDSLFSTGEKMIFGVPEK